MGTICSTARSVRVRENPGDTRCDPSPPRLPQEQRVTGYTHRYTALHTKQDDKSLMLTNPYAFTNIQTGRYTLCSVESKLFICMTLELKETGVNSHFIVTVDETTKILSRPETAITDGGKESVTDAARGTSPNERPSDMRGTTESMNREIICKASEHQPVISGTADEGAESITNAVFDTSPDESQPDTRETTDLINYKSESKPIEQQPLNTELEYPESTVSTDPNQPASSTEPAIAQPTDITEPAGTQQTDDITEPADTQQTDSITDPASTQQTDITEPTDTDLTDPAGTQQTDDITEPASTEATDSITETVNTQQTDDITEAAETQQTDSITEAAETQPTDSITTEPNQDTSSPGENTAPLQTEEYSEHSIPKSPPASLSPKTDTSPVSTDAFDNTIDITTQANSTALGNDTFENSPAATQDETTQGLETDLTNVTRELDEAATDVVESVLTGNITQTPNPTTETEGSVINQITDTTDLQQENNI